MARSIGRRSRPLAAAMLVVALIAAACGSSGGAADTSGAAGAGASAAGQSAGESQPGAGTQGSAAPSTDSAPAQDGGDLVIAGYQDMTTLDKDLAGTSNDALRVMENVLDRLYVLDAKATPQPSLASKYTLSKDKLTWTFTLRDDAKFSDGTKVTAKDVAFSLELARKGTLLGSLYNKFKTVTAKDDATVVITTSTPEPVMLQTLTMETSGVIPADYGGQKAEDFWKKPIGSGPWKFDTVTQGQGVKVVPNETWWGPKGHLNSITFNIVPDTNTRLIQLRSGQAQLIETPSFAQLPTIKTADTDVVTFPSTEVDWLGLNASKPPLDDVHFRRAISLAIDRKSIVEASLRGNGSPAGVWMSKEVLGGYEPADGIKYDVEAAKAELAKSKTPTWDQPINLDFTQGTAGLSEAAQVIQANLQAIGLKLNIQTVDTNTLQAGTKDKSYGIHFGLLTYDIPDASELVSYYFDSNSYNTFLDVSSTKALDKVAAAEFDPAKRLELYKKVADQVVADAATIGLYNVPYYWGASKKLHGFNAILTGQFSFNDLWLG